LQVCQTKDGELERLIALDGRELTSLQAQAEDERIQRLVSHPEQLRAKQKKEREDGEQARNLIGKFTRCFPLSERPPSGEFRNLTILPISTKRFWSAVPRPVCFHMMENLPERVGGAKAGIGQNRKVTKFATWWSL